MDFLNYNLEIIAYHGTYESAANNILRENKFKVEYRKNHWLGQGVYFFREDFERARLWGLLL